MLEVMALVAPALLLAVALGCLGMGSPVLLLVAGMGIAPLFPAAPHGLGVDRIGANLAAMIFTVAAALTGDLAANGLLRMIAGRLEDSLAVKTVAIIHQVTPDQNLLILSGGAAEPDRADKKNPAYRNYYRVLYRVLADGTGAHQTGGTDALLHWH